MEQFTASEVLHKLRERFTSGNSVPVPDVRLTRAEFDAFADLLEAREKAEPVEAIGCLSIRRFRGCDSMVNHDFDYFGSLPDGDYRLYTQPPAQPQDARDAARYRWLKQNDNLYLLAEDVIDEAIAAKESGR